MKYVYALVAGVAFGWITSYVFTIWGDDRTLTDYGIFEVSITAAICFTSTLLFIDKMKNK